MGNYMMNLGPHTHSEPRDEGDEASYGMNTERERCGVSRETMGQAEVAGSSGGRWKE